ncbi:hypothetical protein XIS1_1700034 [Xenorhabdus innexi]|uniref:Uncharacterized protein n=1 Tax=Xenorhabdus innexi TaxID=290109 RepID=A0A1N6MVR2_9GAMM|nr:hypothetical protein XIS1_1700034 [Xenorhabdus innexi]
MGNMVSQNNIIVVHFIVGRGADHDYFRFN